MGRSRIPIFFMLCGIAAAQLNYGCFSNDAIVLEAVPSPEKLVFNQAITTQPTAVAYCSTEQQVRRGGVPHARHGTTFHS